MQIKIVGSTYFGWHVATELNPDMLITFALFAEVYFFDITIGGVHLAPSTIYGYAKCAECPFTMDDAHAVLAMVRPLLLEAKNGSTNRCG